LPDFIIGGAPRSGTTWLYHLLDRHPAIYMARPVHPEPKFFLVDDLYRRGLQYYARTWFEAVPEAKKAGEKSTNYLESPTAARRIHQHLPGVKLVFILRDPVERAYSNYLWSKSNGLENESFERALALEETREANLSERWRPARPHAYFSRGLYADLLGPYLELFDRRQILCLRFEGIREQAALLADQLHNFLGVACRSQDLEGLGIINASRPASTPMSVETRQALAARYDQPNRRLSALLGPDFKMWTS
jgi:hypothetical protein